MEARFHCILKNARFGLAILKQLSWFTYFLPSSNYYLFSFKANYINNFQKSFSSTRLAKLCTILFICMSVFLHTCILYSLFLIFFALFFFFVCLSLSSVFCSFCFSRCLFVCLSVSFFLSVCPSFSFSFFMFLSLLTMPFFQNSFWCQKRFWVSLARSAIRYRRKCGKVNSIIHPSIQWK